MKCGLPQDYKKAIDLYIANNYLEGVVDVSRLLDPTDNINNIQTCANHFKKLGQHAYAKEAYLKLNDL